MVYFLAETKSVVFYSFYKGISIFANTFFICVVFGNVLITQNSQNLSHNHSVGSHTHTLGGNTGANGGHSHTTNSLLDKDTGLNKTNTGNMSAHSSGSVCLPNIAGSNRFGILTNADGTTFTLDGSNKTDKQLPGTSANISLYNQASYYGYWILKLNSAHTHDMQHKHGTTSVADHTHTLPENTGGSTAFNSGSTGDTESRPVDFTYKVWKRTA